MAGGEGPAGRGAARSQACDKGQLQQGAAGAARVGDESCEREGGVPRAGRGVRLPPLPCLTCPLQARPGAPQQQGGRSPLLCRAGRSRRATPSRPPSAALPRGVSSSLLGTSGKGRCIWRLATRSLVANLAISLHWRPFFFFFFFPNLATLR